MIPFINNIIFYNNPSKDWMDWLSLISTILVPILIFIFGSILSKNQAKKILKDNKINRLANYHSNILLDTGKQKSFIIVNINTKTNYTDSKPYKNVLLSGEQLKNTEVFFITVNFAFKSIGKIIPNNCQVDDFMLYDTAIDKNLQHETEQLRINFKNYEPNFRNVSTDNDGLIILDLLCCVTEMQYEKLKSYEADGKKFNFIMNFKIKNQFGIVSDCSIQGRFLQKDTRAVGTNTLGGEKVLWDLVIDETYLQIKTTYEVDVN